MNLVLLYYAGLGAGGNDAPVFPPHNGQFRRQFSTSLTRASSTTYSTADAPVFHPETNVICFGVSGPAGSYANPSLNAPSQLLFFSPDGTKMGEFQPAIVGYSNCSIANFGPAPGGRWFMIVNCRVGTTTNYQGFVIIIDSFNPNSVNSLKVIAIYKLVDPSSTTTYCQAYGGTGIIEKEKSVQDNSDIYTLLLSWRVANGTVATMVIFNMDFTIKSTNTKIGVPQFSTGSIVDTFSTKELGRPFAMIRSAKYVQVAPRGTPYASVHRLFLCNAKPNTTYSLTATRAVMGTVPVNFSNGWDGSVYTSAEPAVLSNGMQSISPSSITTDSTGYYVGDITLTEVKPYDGDYQSYAFANTSQLRIEINGTFEGTGQQIVRATGSLNMFPESGAETAAYPPNTLYHHKVKSVVISVPFTVISFPYDEPNGQGFLHVGNHSAPYSYASGAYYSTFLAPVQTRGKTYLAGRFMMELTVPSPRARNGSTFPSWGMYGSVADLNFSGIAMSYTDNTLGMSCSWGDHHNFSNVIGEPTTVLYYISHTGNSVGTLAGTSSYGAASRVSLPGMCFWDRTPNINSKAVYQLTLQANGGVFARYRLTGANPSAWTFSISAAGTGASYSAGPWGLSTFNRASWYRHPSGDYIKPNQGGTTAYTVASSIGSAASMDMCQRAHITAISTLNFD